MEQNNLKLQIIYILISISFSYQTCSFTQYCSNENNSSTCKLPETRNFEPFIYNSTDITCPDFKDKLSCCNKGQNLLMSKI